MYKYTRDSIASTDNVEKRYEYWISHSFLLISFRAVSISDKIEVYISFTVFLDGISSKSVLSFRGTALVSNAPVAV